jgi:hypothetical protein
MARTHVHLVLPDGASFHAQTDLHGHGIVHAGEEFIARECWSFGSGTRLMKGGRKLHVRVKEVERRGRSYHLIHVEVLQDSTPERTSQVELF